MLNVGQNDLLDVTFPTNYVIFIVKMCHYLAALWFSFVVDAFEQ